MANGNNPLIRPLTGLADRLNRLVEGRLWLKVLIGMGLGIVTGILLGPGVGWVRPALAQRAHGTPSLARLASKPCNGSEAGQYLLED